MIQNFLVRQIYGHRPFSWTCLSPSPSRVRLSYFSVLKVINFQVFLGQFFDTFPFFLFSALSPDKIYVVPSLIFVAFAAPIFFCLFVKRYPRFIFKIISIFCLWKVRTDWPWRSLVDWLRWLI